MARIGTSMRVLTGPPCHRRCARNAPRRCSSPAQKNRDPSHSPERLSAGDPQLVASRTRHDRAASRRHHAAEPVSVDAHLPVQTDAEPAVPPSSAAPRHDRPPLVPPGFALRSLFVRLTHTPSAGIPLPAPYLQMSSRRSCSRSGPSARRRLAAGFPQAQQGPTSNRRPPSPAPRGCRRPAGRLNLGAGGPVARGPSDRLRRARTRAGPCVRRSSPAGAMLRDSALIVAAATAGVSWRPSWARLAATRLIECSNAARSTPARAETGRRAARTSAGAWKAPPERPRWRR